MSAERYEQLRASLKKHPKRWLVTGAAGFIGSHLVEHLLHLGQKVVGLDNLATGKKENIEAVLAAAPANLQSNFTFLESDIRDSSACMQACRDIDLVLHQAALGSVPRSIKDPKSTHETNVNGFINILEAARKSGVQKLVYASSSSVYGDSPSLPKREESIGRPLSPYAVSKFSNEVHARTYWANFGLPVIGLRYFNVFGPRQDPGGPYAAVIPLWFSALLDGQRPYINGDGETSRDFCFIDNAVSANLLAALAGEEASAGMAYNVACGEQTTLNQLYRIIQDAIEDFAPGAAAIQPEYREFRAGDVRHSLADTSKAGTYLGYEPITQIKEGIESSVKWYVNNLGSGNRI